MEHWMLQSSFRVRRTLGKRNRKTGFVRKVQVFSDLPIQTCFQML